MFHQAVSTLVFDEDAVMDANNSSPFASRMERSPPTSIISSNSSVQFGTRSNTNPKPNGQDYYNVRPVPYHISRVTRPWSTSDQIGTFHVLSYLIIFRPSGQPAPTVSDIALRPTAARGAATAKVDGTEFSLSAMK